MECPICGSGNPEGAAVCGQCGTALDGQTPSGQELPKDTRLAGGAYLVKGKLGQGGFAITYRGLDVRLKREVAIKEFFPDGCNRKGSTVVPSGSLTLADYQASRAKFLEEGQGLARFRHPGIVDVYAVFEENKTAYLVMEFLQGRSLKELVEERGPLPERDAVGYVRQAGEALEVVHQANVLHRDIKPDNIMVVEGGRVVLIDFGAARAFATGKTGRPTVILTPGYAPLEQYSQQARFGPFTDVYALGATLYHLLTGQVPVPATDRASGAALPAPAAVNPAVSRRVSDAVLWALAMRVDKRPPSVRHFLDALSGPATPRADGRARTAPPAPPPPRRTSAPRQPAPPSPPPVQSSTSPTTTPAASLNAVANAVIITAVLALLFDGIGTIGTGSNLMALVLLATALAASAFALYAGIQMKQRRNYTAAVVGSAGLMYGGLWCCCLGPVVGVASLVTLLKPEVKALFEE